MLVNRAVRAQEYICKSLYYAGFASRCLPCNMRAGLDVVLRDLWCALGAGGSRSETGLREMHFVIGYA